MMYRDDVSTFSAQWVKVPKDVAPYESLSTDVPHIYKCTPFQGSSPSPHLTDLFIEDNIDNRVVYC